MQGGVDIGTLCAAFNVTPDVVRAAAKELGVEIDGAQFTADATERMFAHFQGARGHSF